MSIEAKKTGAENYGIVRGVPEGAKQQVAELYWEAFRGKLRPALGGSERALNIIRESINGNRFVCALDDTRVIGAIGYHHSNRPAIDMTWSTLRANYPWSALFRLLALAPLSRTPKTGELLLDGISVHPDARGRGVGTALLAEVRAIAIEHSYSRIRLAVVDTNPRARALYERVGYMATSTSSHPVVGAIYGFASATELELAVDETPGVVE